MKKPIIGISASMIYEEKDELFLGDKYSCAAYSYIDAVYKSWGIPITLPILKDVSAIREQVKLLDGLILSGGRDVDPHFYGEEPLEKLEAIFPERDVHEIALIKAAIELHRYKGTPWAIREIVRRLGFGEVRIIEGLNGQTYDGSINYNGSHVYGASSYWAHYRIIMNSVITNDQAALLRKTLAAFAPARCLLAALDYQAASLRYNGRAAYDGNFNFGAA